MGSTVDRVWRDLRDRLGEDLRMVTRYDSREFETRMREDVRERYTEREGRAIVDDTIVRQLGLSNTEQRFETGELDAFVDVFEHAWVFARPDGLSSKSGFIVFVQRDGDVATARNLTAVLDYFEEASERSLDA